jgi:tetratricopeptide (TPR) repeat protein
VAAADSNNASVHYELGQTLRLAGDLPGALTSLEKALELNPELREGYYALGVALRQQGAVARRPRPESESPGDELYGKAREAAARGDLAAARDQLSEALRRDANHAPAHGLLGFVLGQRGDLGAALVHLERAAELQPESADARYSLGVALWLSGSRPRALGELRRSVELDPAAGAAWAFLGIALRETGDLGGARASLQRAIALLPPTAAVYVDLALVYLRGGERDKGLGQLEAGLNLPGPWAPAPDWAAAATALREAIRASPDRAELHNLLGRLLGRQGAPSDQVAACFREAVRLKPAFAEAHNNLGLVLVQAGDDSGGIAAFREAVRLQPDYADARANLGAALAPTDAAEAIQELEKAVALAPGLVKARFNLASAYGASPAHGRTHEIAQLKEVIALAPTFARAHLALGKALLREGDVGAAVAALQEAVRLEPERGDAHYQLGLALARAGRQAEATAALEKGRALAAADEREQKALLDLTEGRAALERGDLDGALAKLRRALGARPDSAAAQATLGTVLEKKGEAEPALAAYRRALELNPGEESAREGQARLTRAADPVPAGRVAAPPRDDPRRVAEVEDLVRQGRFAEVEPLLAEYVKEHPGSTWGFYALGYSRFAQQKIGGAIEALARSLELDVTNAEAHKILGRTLMIVGRYDAAQLEFEQALRYKPDTAEVHYNLGKLHSIQDNWETARREFEAALRLDPSYVEARDGLGFALEALGDDAGAIAQYQQAIALDEARQGRFAAPHVNLSALYNRTGHPGKAREHAGKALELDPKAHGAWFQKAKADEREGRLEEAVLALKAAIALHSRASSYYYVLAGLYRRLGKAEESRAALDSFKRLDLEASELEKARRLQNRRSAAAPGPEG